MKLRVHGIRLEAAHAAYEWEQNLGTVLEVDVELAYRRDPKTDRLAEVIPVEEIVSTSHRVSDTKTYKILEALANDILSAFWKKHRAKLAEVLVRVRKVRPKSDRRIAGYEVEVRKP